MRPMDRLVGNVGVALDAVLQHCDELRHIHTSFILALKGEQKQSWQFVRLRKIWNLYEIAELNILKI